VTILYLLAGVNRRRRRRRGRGNFLQAVLELAKK